MTREVRQLILAVLALLCLLAVLWGGMRGARSLPRVPLGPLMGAIAVPHSAWLARCSALPVEALDGIEIVKASVSPGQVSVFLRRGTAYGWFSAHSIGVYQGATVYACYGPTALRGRMAASSTCSHAIPWNAVKALPGAVRDWVAARSTCCGRATMGGQEVTAWPCSWAPARVTVEELTSIGPGVVGSESPCPAGE